MKLASLKFILFIKLLLISQNPAFAEIKSPNYDFTFASLAPFMPGADLEKIKQNKAIQSDIFENNGNLKILRLKLRKATYTIDIYIQTKDEKIVDMYARLPQHFNHDLFLTDLQKTYKKQDKYIQKDMNALYVWMNRENNNIIYQGSCSITCFPMFIEVVSTEKTVIPLYKKFNEALPKW